MASKWFHYTGSNPADPADYTVFGDEAPEDCAGFPQQLCAIQAEEDTNSEPILDVTIALEMAQALQNQTNTDNVLLKQR